MLNDYKLLQEKREENIPELRIVVKHKSSKTTEIYTYVSTKSIGRIKSPLDTLNLKRGVVSDKNC